MVLHYLILISYLSMSPEMAFANETIYTSDPQIYLGGYYKSIKRGRWVIFNSMSDFDTSNQRIIIDNNDGITINVVDSKVVEQIMLTCSADYSVYWEMKDVQPIDFQGVDLGMQVTFDEDSLQSANVTEYKIQEFHSNLVLYNAPSLTGMYSCRSFNDNDNNTLKMDVYVFLNGFKRRARKFAAERPEIDVGINGNDSLVIPCKVTSKDELVILSMKEETGSWIPVNATFDPKRGFLIDPIKFKVTAGIYKCTVDGSEEMLVVKVNEGIIINDNNEGQPPDSINFLNFTGELKNTVLMIELEVRKDFPIFYLTGGRAGCRQSDSGDGLECCSNSSTGPNLFIVQCQNKPHCEMMKKIFAEIKVTRTTSGLASVSREEEEEEEESPCVYTTEYMMVESFVMQCIGDGVKISEEVLADFKSPTSKEEIKYVLLSSNYTYSPERSIKVSLKLQKNSTELEGGFQFLESIDTNAEIIVGEKFAFDCCGVHYYHAVGREQQIVWRNGSVSKLETPEKTKRGRFSPLSMDYCFTYEYPDNDEDLLITADINMQYLQCIVPLWYDAKPSVIRIDLNIREPEKPKIVLGEGVNVTLNENQLGLIKLDCILKKGLPTPVMTWSKDGYKISQAEKLWSIEKTTGALPVLRLLFMRALKETEGEYKCTAENAYGNASQTIYVKIRPRSYMDYWIALAIFGGFFALIILCALRVTTKEKLMASKQIQPFREEKYQ